MKHGDLEHLRLPKTSWLPHTKCMDCRGAPSCPQLHDDLWQKVSPHANITNECATCGCSKHYHNGWHMLCNSCHGCSKYVVRDADLLCLECVERRLGRELTVDDLSPCIENYSTYVMLHRQAVELLGRTIDLRTIDLVAQANGLPSKQSIDPIDPHETGGYLAYRKDE